VLISNERRYMQKVRDWWIESFGEDQGKIVRRIY